MTLNRIQIPSPNQSGRGGQRVTTIVLHTAEGALTYQSLGSFFGSSSSAVSSHVGIDDTPNTEGEYVPRSQKAWTAASANPWCVQAELCAFASWDSATWQSHQTMLANTAQWIAEEAAYFGIPLVLLSESQAQDPSQMGICQHADLGSMGGGHWDCGPDFPMDQVLAMASGQDDDMALSDDDKKWLQSTIEAQCEVALRQQLQPNWECFNRVIQATSDAIRQTPANIPK